MPSIASPTVHAPPEIAPLYYAAMHDRLCALKTFAGGLAHNLRNPLTAILGRAELIGLRRPELREQMRGIVAHCERINGMLHGALAKLALEAETAPRPVNLNELVERECEFLRFDRHFKHEIATEYALAEALPSVTAVYGELARAFVALVQNSVTAMRHGCERRLSVASSCEDNAISLSVRDTGCGIAPENLPRVFEPGFTTRQDDRYGTSPVEGTGCGYGLTIAACTVQGYGGTIELSSEPGAGTTATIILPA